MRELLEIALNYPSLKGASYSEIRIIKKKTESIILKNGRIHTIQSEFDEGFGIRVLLDGAWGFAASSRIEKDEVEAKCRLAIEAAKATSLIKRHDVVLSKEEIVRDTFKNSFVKDPFKVSLDEKIRLLLEADKEMRKDKRIKVTLSFLLSFLEKRLFGNSEGSLIEEETIGCGGGISAIAIGKNDVQKRSFPNIDGDYATKGYEFIESLDLLGNAARVREEAVELLFALQCPSKTTTVILGGGQMAFQIHESIGHPVEFDRVLGREESFAGGSFLGVEKLGNFQYASPLVNIYADATLPGGFGSFGYDDEGVKAKRTPIIKEGKFVGYLSSRETASILKTQSSGAARTSSWRFTPLIRMTNINLEPGERSEEEMISEVKDGIYMEGTKSWSIDERRLNFQFGTEIAWEIKDGKLSRVLKNPTYTGITPQFWRSCDAIAKEWRMWGMANCAKGEPTQIIRVGHGTSPARFRNVKVGY